MIVQGESTIIDYDAPFDQGLVSERFNWHQIRALSHVVYVRGGARALFWTAAGNWA